MDAAPKINIIGANTSYKTSRNTPIRSGTETRKSQRRVEFADLINESSTDDKL